MNGTIAGTKAAVERLVVGLFDKIGATQRSMKFNYCEHMPYQKLKVRLKKEIVALKMG